MNAYKNNISYTYGDTFNIPIKFESFENGDKLRFQVTKSETDALLINKTYSASDNKTVNVSLSEKELKKIPLGEYIYRMTIMGINGVIKTRISGRLDVIWGTDSDGDIKKLFITNAMLMDEINNKIDKDERFKLAAIGDAGTNKVLFVGDSNSSDGINFYSKEQTDDLLENKVDKLDGFYLASPMTEHDTVTGKDKPAILFSDGETDEAITIPAYTSDLENDSGFVTSKQMNEAISDIQDGAVDAYTKEETDNLLASKVDKDESGDFSLAALADAGDYNIILVGGPSNPTPKGVSFYSKSQIDSKLSEIEPPLDGVSQNMVIIYNSENNTADKSYEEIMTEFENGKDVLLHIVSKNKLEMLGRAVRYDDENNIIFSGSFRNLGCYVTVSPDDEWQCDQYDLNEWYVDKAEYERDKTGMETALDSIIAIQNELIGGGTV